MIIYKIENEINGKVYIGATTRKLNSRKNEHKHDAFTRVVAYPLHQDIRLYGWENFHFEMIDDSADTKAELNKKESYYISLYNATTENGNYNTSTGYGSSGYKHTEEHIQKITGSGNPNAKLSDEEVAQIKLLLFNETIPQKDIANLFGVGQNHISNIKHGKVWKHVEVVAV